MNTLTFFDQFNTYVTAGVDLVTPDYDFVFFSLEDHMTNFVLLNMSDEPLHSHESGMNKFNLEIVIGDSDVDQMHTTATEIHDFLNTNGGWHKTFNAARSAHFLVHPIAPVVPRNIGSREYVTQPGVFFLRFLVRVLVEDV